MNVDGIDKVLANMAKVSAVVQGKALKDGLMAGGLVVEGQTKVNIRNHNLIDTGFMLGSVKAQAQGNDHVVVGVGAEYSIYHEFGTSRGLPARPFLAPALHKNKEQIIAAVRTSVANAIESAL